MGYLKNYIGFFSKISVFDQPNSSRALTYQGSIVGEENQRPGDFQVLNPSFDFDTGRLWNHSLGKVFSC
jgi:hypothetical protein